MRGALEVYAAGRWAPEGASQKGSTPGGLADRGIAAEMRQSRELAAVLQRARRARAEADTPRQLTLGSGGIRAIRA
jgi:hypothetical protein